MDDASLDYVARMTKLHNLNLSGTRITEAGLAKLSPLEEVSWLRLNDLPITDAAIPLLSAMRGLTNLEMNHTQVTAAGFRELRAGIQRINIAP